MRAPSDRWLSPAVAVAVVLSRIPFLTRNYGYDGDAWNVAWAAKQMVEQGRYVWSRPPGYPVHEISCAAFWGAHPLATNGFTTLMSAAGSALFFGILRRLGARRWDAVLGALALAFVPVIYVNSTVTLDYVWALMFILAALAAVLAGRPTWAGVALGAAIGCRITSGAMLIPLGMILCLDGKETAAREARGRLARLLLSTFGVGLLTYAPALLTHGVGAVRFVDESISFSLRARLTGYGLTLGVWGILGTAGLCIAIVSTLPWFKPNPVLVSDRASTGRALSWACLAAVAVYTAAFVRLPLEFAYLIPAVPFVILGVAAHAGRVPCRLFLIALLVAPFFGHLGFGRSRSWAGPVLVDAQRKGEQQASIRAVYEHASELPMSSVMVAGPEINRIRAFTPAHGETLGAPRFQFSGLLSSTERAAALNDGATLYLLVKEGHLYTAAFLVERGPDGRIRRRVDRFSPNYAH